MLSKYISYWQKDEPQTDDMLVIGFKYCESIFQKFSNEFALERFN
jgi:hypothetical protein